MTKDELIEHCSSGREIPEHMIAFVCPTNGGTLTNICCDDCTIEVFEKDRIFFTWTVGIGGSNRTNASSVRESVAAMKYPKYTEMLGKKITTEKKISVREDILKKALWLACKEISLVQQDKTVEQLEMELTRRAERLLSGNDLKPDLPKEIKACCFDDGWKFDIPIVIYFPWRYRRIHVGNSADETYGFVENLCIDILEDCQKTIVEFTEDFDSELEWRGWGKRFSRRVNAIHKWYEVDWFYIEGELDFKIKEIR
jgi:hypothetical protein